MAFFSHICMHIYMHKMHFGYEYYNMHNFLTFYTHVNLHSTEMSKICTNIIKSIRKHVIRIFGMVFYRENVYPYF